MKKTLITTIFMFMKENLIKLTGCISLRSELSLRQLFVMELSGQDSLIRLLESNYQLKPF